MGYHEAVARNPHLLFWGKVFTEAKGLAVVATLFLMHRGLTIDEIFFTGIVWSIVTLITEVPSGYLADYIGRKRTIMVGMALYLTACVIRIYAHGFVTFTIIFILFSVGFSCMSGTEEALLYDSLKEVNKEHEMLSLNARLRSAKFVARLVLAVVGVCVVKDLTETQYKILATIDVAMILIAFIIVSNIKEPLLKSKDLARKKGYLIQSLKTIVRYPWLMRATVSKLLVFFAGFFLFRAYQPFLMDNGATVIMIGIYFLLSRGGIFLIYWYSGSLVKLVGTARLINGSAILAVIFLAFSLLFGNPWLLVITLGIATMMTDVREPLYSKAINQRIESGNRATTLSVLNMAKAVLDIPLLLLIGVLAKMNINNAIIGAIVMCLIAIIFFWSKEKEFKEPLLIKP